ncbi:MAG: GNAT family N-acetyltransferase [Photobacterium halotolerans]
MKIREASLAEAASVLARIKEFDHPETEHSLATRVRGRCPLILVAEKEGELMGVKIGYSLSETCYYSWLGGVVAEGRHNGVAQALMSTQEAWVKAQGYQELRVKSRNRYPSMLRLLLRNGYQIEHMEKKDGIEDYRLHFVKSWDNQGK